MNFIFDFNGKKENIELEEINIKDIDKVTIGKLILVKLSNKSAYHGFFEGTEGEEITLTSLEGLGLIGLFKFWTTHIYVQTSNKLLKQND